jgi:TonB family protein
MRPRFLLSAFAILAVCATAPISSQEEKTPPPPAAQETLASVLERAYQLISEGSFNPAREELEKATALAGGPCGECLLGFSHVYAADKKWDRAVEAAQQAIPLLKSPGPRARAYDQLGVALVVRGGRGALSKAEEALRQGAELGGAWGTLARYNLAEVLARQQKWAETMEASRRYLQEAGPEGTALKESRILLCVARSHLPEEPLPEESLPERTERSGPLRIKEGETTRPEIIRQFKPVYSEKARQAGTRGTVIVEAIIDEEGCVRNIRSLQGLPNGLTKAAMEAVRQWVFSPATLEGKPVKVYYVLTINFNVQYNPG